MHVSVHASGVIHFTQEEGRGNGDQIAIALMMGQAGVMKGKGIVGTPLSDEGPAVKICSAIYPITDLADDFRTFERTRENVFVIDASKFSEGVTGIVIGVWGVPRRNQDQFWWNNRSISEEMVFKSPGTPPIWI